jgi:hypothetical protein
VAIFILTQFNPSHSMKIGRGRFYR